VADDGTISNGRAILNNFTGVSIDRMEKVNPMLRGLVGTKSVSSCDAGIWAKGFGSYLNQNTRSGITGYNAWNAGTALGIDHCFSDTLILGVSGGYAYGNVNSVNNDTTVINSAQASVYGGYQDKMRPFFIDTALTFAYNWQVGQRNIIDGNTLLGKANANYNGQQYGAYVGGGYSFNLTDTIRFTPLASLQYNNMHLNGYTESGAGALNLTISGQNYNQIQSGLGARITTVWDNQWGRWTPELHSKWLYDFFTDPFAVTSNFNGGGANFGTNGARPAVNSFNVGGELKMELKKADEVAIIGRIDTQLKEGFTGVFGSFTIRF
jgi:outer membrane autotransporter protein